MKCITITAPLWCCRQCRHGGAWLLLGAVLAALLLSACQPALMPPADSSAAASIEHPALGEISGMAASTRRDDLLWVINDSGNRNQLHALAASDGSLLASISVAGISNMDWEDLAAFALDGQHWLLIADVGDNQAQRRFVHLYLLPEPELQTASPPPGELRVQSETVFSYADGARDVEAVAVDVQRREVLLVSKRDTPPGVYTLPLLLHGSKQPLLAQRIADVAGLLPPTEADRLRYGRYQPFVAQPTALDIHAADNIVSAVLLSYKHAYLFQRRWDEGWQQAWRTPHVIGIPPMPQTEAAGFDRMGCGLWVTTEQLPAALHRIELGHCNEKLPQD